MAFFGREESKQGERKRAFNLLMGMTPTMKSTRTCEQKCYVRDVGERKGNERVFVELTFTAIQKIRFRGTPNKNASQRP